MDYEPAYPFYSIIQSPYGVIPSYGILYPAYCLLYTPISSYYAGIILYYVGINCITPPPTLERPGIYANNSAGPSVH